MNLTEQKVKKIEEARMKFLWKVRIFECGLNYQKEKNDVNLSEKIKPVVEFDLDLQKGEIGSEKIAELDDKNFAYHLGKHIQEISIVVIKNFSEMIYPLDAILVDYENELKEILL